MHQRPSCSTIWSEASHACCAQLILYEPVGKEGWAALPVDVHRQLARPRAMQGMLRLRTSAEFRPSQVRARGWDVA